MVRAGGGDAQGHHVGGSAAGDGLDVGDGDGVEDIVERQRVGTGAEIDAAAGEGADDGDVVAIGAADDGFDVRHLNGGRLGEGQRIGAGTEVDGRPGDHGGEGDGVGGGAAGDGLDVGDGDGVDEAAELQGVDAAGQIRSSRR